MLHTAGIFETPIYLAMIKDHQKWVDLAHSELSAMEAGEHEYIMQENKKCERLRHSLLPENNDDNSVHHCPNRWLNRPEWESLKEQIKEHLLEAYSKFLGSDYMDDQRVLITDSWLNVCDSGGFQFFHNHANSMLSWTYFMCLRPEEGHTQLEFARPEINSRPFFATPPGGSPFLDSFVVPDVREGSMLIWPGHVSHGFRENEADGRMSMSGNSLPSVIRNPGYVLKIIEE